MCFARFFKAFTFSDSDKHTKHTASRPRQERPTTFEGRELRRFTTLKWSRHTEGWFFSVVNELRVCFHLVQGRLDSRALISLVLVLVFREMKWKFCLQLAGPTRDSWLIFFTTLKDFFHQILSLSSMSSGSTPCRRRVYDDEHEIPLVWRRRCGTHKRLGEKFDRSFVIFFFSISSEFLLLKKYRIYFLSTTPSFVVVVFGCCSAPIRWRMKTL